MKRRFLDPFSVLIRAAILPQLVLCLSSPVYSQDDQFGLIDDEIPKPFHYVTCPLVDNVRKLDPFLDDFVTNIPVGMSPRGIVLKRNRGKGYVANGISNTTSVIDLTKDTVIANIAVGTEPNGVASTPDGDLAYVANSRSGTVSVINTASDTVVTTVTLGGTPFRVDATNDIYGVTNPQNNTVSFLSTATNTVLATRSIPIAWDVAFNQSGTRVAVTSPEIGVLILETTTFNPIGSIPVTGAWEVNYSHNGLYLGITSGLGVFYQADADTNVVQGSATLGGTPHGVSYTLDGSKVYVGIENADTGHGIIILDTTSVTQIGFIPKASPPLQIGFWDKKYYCAPYRNVDPGLGQWMIGQVVTIAFPNRSACPNPTYIHSDGSVWSFIGPCEKKC